MDGVSSALAVVSLAIQLVETGEKISEFLSGVQDAPSEVIKLGQTLDQLNSTLKQVSYLLEQQYLVLRLPGSPVFITNALESCEKRIRTLEDVIQKAKKSMDHRNRVQRSWAAMRFVSKKEDIQEMQNQLRDAETGLQTAMLSNSWQLQMHHIHATSSVGLQGTVIEDPSVATPIRTLSHEMAQTTYPSAPREVFRSITKETYRIWYRGFFGRVNIQSKSNSLNRSNIRKSGIKTTSNETIITMTPIFLRKTLELRFQNSFGRISRTLSTYPVLEDTEPIFKMCSTGDLQGLQVALSSGAVSPFVVDEQGWSLLHLATANQELEICKLLLDVGVDPDHVDQTGLKAMALSAHGLYMNITAERSVDTLRLLTQSQNEISSWEISEFWRYCMGPVEAAEFMLLQELIPSESDASDGEDPFPILATALRAYGQESSRWESFLRLLLRKRVCLHVPVPRDYGVEETNDYLGPMYPCKILEYGTPLDELFGFTMTPSEGKAAADRWLEILSSEGYDVKDYLEEEQELHAAQMQLTYYSSYVYDDHRTPRQLIYHWGSHPSVSWDWWISPNSPIYLVQEEFKHMTCLGEDDYLWFCGWEDSWPLRYPAWSDHRRDYEDSITDRNWKPLYDRAQERANRRMEKKSMKLARAQGFRKRDQMPGAWPV